jgi:hypothetical protein
MSDVDKGGPEKGKAQMWSAIAYDRSMARHDLILRFADDMVQMSISSKSKPKSMFSLNS